MDADKSGEFRCNSVVEISLISVSNPVIESSQRFDQ